MATEEETKTDGTPEAIRPVEGELSETDLEKAAGGAVGAVALPAVQSTANHQEGWMELNSFDIGGSE